MHYSDAEIVKFPDHSLVAMSLHRWANYIETDDADVPQSDLDASGVFPKVLSAEQKQLVDRLRSLSASTSKILNREKTDATSFEKLTQPNVAIQAVQATCSTMMRAREATLQVHTETTTAIVRMIEKCETPEDFAKLRDEIRKLA